MTGIDSYSTTPATNATADAGAINWSEGQAPSTVNNTARQWMADTRSRHNDLIWFQYGTGDQGAGNLAVPAVYASGTSFTIAGVNVTAVYHTNRRVRAVGVSTGTIYGSISSSSFSTNTTVNVTWDSGSLSNETLVVSLSQIPVTGSPVGGLGPTIINTRNGTNAQRTALTILNGNAGALGTNIIATQMTDSVSTSPAVILTVPSPGTIVTVVGISGGNEFCDVLNCTPNSVSLINGLTNAGSPTSRTYALSAFSLTLQMGSGTYNMNVLAIGTDQRA